MTVVQISAAYTGKGTIVYGLGDDNKVYVWDSGGHTWVLHS